MMLANRNSLLALLLTTTLVFVQTALPWMHAGCEHDHSAGRSVAASPAQHQCHGHQHAHSDGCSQDSSTEPAFDHRHDRELVDDCAACRFLLLSSVAVQATEVDLVEQVTLLPSLPPIAALSSEPVGLYRSRAPPALS